MLGKNRKKGFTLIELIVVIAILAILAVALIPLINSFIDKSRISNAMATVSTLETAGVAFQADVASFPDDTNTLISESELASNTRSRNNWDGPYLNDSTDINPWGGEYLLDNDTDHLGSPDILDWTLFLNAIESDIPGPLVNRLDKNLDGSVNNISGRVQGDGAFLEITLLTDTFDGDGNDQDDQDL